MATFPLREAQNAYFRDPKPDTAIAVAREQYAAGKIDIHRLETKITLALLKDR